MKKMKFMKHCTRDFSGGISLCFAIAFFLLVGLPQGNAQSIRRQSIGISGANMVSDGILVKQSIGQPYATTTYYENGIGFRPGFQQPTASSQSSLIAKELVQSNLTLTVFPNPAVSSVRIESEEVIGKGVLKVWDSNGRLVVNEQLSELKSHAVNCSGWANGLYLISVTTEGHTTYSSKLIISK